MICEQSVNLVVKIRIPLLSIEIVDVIQSQVLSGIFGLQAEITERNLDHRRVPISRRNLCRRGAQGIVDHPVLSGEAVARVLRGLALSASGGFSAGEHPVRILLEQGIVVPEGEVCGLGLRLDGYEGIGLRGECCQHALRKHNPRHEQSQKRRQKPCAFRSFHRFPPFHRVRLNPLLTL